jgi:hypothetical protein
MIELSSPTMSMTVPSGPIGGHSTMHRHHQSRMLFFNSTPSGP